MINKANDDFEKELFEFAKKDNEVPLYVNKAINEAINRIKPNKLFSKFKRVAIIILSLGIVSTGVVFAKEIVNFFKTIFTNSTPGIEAAVENGYIQNVDMDFVYDNDIGIKVNNIVRDNGILDISLVFDCINMNNIDNIKLTDFEIFLDNNPLSIDVGENNFNKDISSVQIMNDVINKYNLYYKSLLFKTDSLEKYKNVEIKISSIDIYQNNEIIRIQGNWNIILDLNLNKTITENNYYKSDYDNNILEVSNTINITNLVIDISLKNKFDISVISESENVKLLDENNKEIKNTSIFFNEDNNSISLKYDYGIYNLPNKLTLYIKYNEEKDTYIKLYK